MTPRRARRRVPYVLYVVSALCVPALLTCSPERLRPGPPTLSLELPAGDEVTSPDTIAVRIRASDPNGLDTVSVGLRDQFVTLSAFASTELSELVLLRVPDSLQVGTVVTIFGAAADLSGQLARTSRDLTVVQNAPSP